MAIDINSVFGRSTNRPSIADAFNTGRQNRQERIMNKQTIQANEQSAEINDQNIQINDQTIQSGEVGQQQEQDEARLNGIVNSALILQGTPQSSWMRVLSNRIQTFEDEGIPTDDLMELRGMLKSGDVEGATEAIDQAAELKNRIGGNRPSVQSVSQIQTKNPDGTTGLANVVQMSNQAEPIVVPLDGGVMPDGLQVAGEETPEEKRLAAQSVRYQDMEKEFTDFQDRLQYQNKEQQNQVLMEKLQSGMGKDMAGAVSNIGMASKGIIDANKLLSLVESFESGGTSRLLDTFQNVMGFRPQDEVRAENLMRRQAMSLLALFTGAKSEGEREFVLEMVPNFKLNSEGNKELIQQMIDDFNIQIEAGNAARGGVDSWNTYQSRLSRSLEPLKPRRRM